MESIDETSASGLSELSEIESLRLLVESVKDYAIFMLDLGGRVASWNASAQQITGYTAAEILGRHFSLFYTKEDIDRGHPDAELQLAAEQGRYEEEGWRIGKDGSRFIAKITISPMRDKNGKLRGFSKVARDITELRRREAALYESQEYFRNAFDDALIGIAVIAPQGNFLKVNRAFCEMTGYSKAEMLARNFRMLTHPDDLENNLSLFKQMVDGQRHSYFLEKRYFHKNGEIIYIRCHSSFVRDPDGTPRYLFSHVENITELKRQEAEREKLIAELQKTLTRVKTLSGLIPICGWCKNVRSDQGYWHTVEEYVGSHSEATFTHGICPTCLEKHKDKIAQARAQESALLSPGI